MSEVSFATALAEAMTRIVAIQELILTDSNAYKTPGQRDSSGNPFWTNSIRPVGINVQARGTTDYQISVIVDMTLHYAGITEGDNGVVDNLLQTSAIPLTLQYFLERRLLQHTSGQDGVTCLEEIAINTSGRINLPDNMVGARFALTLPFNLKFDQAY